MVELKSNTVQIEDEHIITDLETLKVISNPLRLQILERIGLACETDTLTTVKQLSEALDLPPTKLYYHVNLLEKHDLIRVAETRVVSGIIEKHYQVRAKRLRANMDISQGSKINRDEGMELVLSSIKSMFDTVHGNVEKSLQHRLSETADPDREKVPMHYGQTTMQLSIEDATSLINEIDALAEKYKTINRPDGKVFSFAIVFNPNHHMSVSTSQS